MYKNFDDMFENSNEDPQSVKFFLHLAFIESIFDYLIEEHLILVVRILHFCKKEIPPGMKDWEKWKKGWKGKKNIPWNEGNKNFYAKKYFLSTREL